MKLSTMALALGAALAFTTVLPSMSEAANARHPYRRINRTNDVGNRTGDVETARLNQQQLDQARGR